MATVERKDQTRATAEKLIRHAAHLIRSNPKLGRVDKMLVGIRPRPDQTVIITSARRELPDGVETIDTLRAESKRLLPDKTLEAA